jgi:TRAP-type C4-dicarboxylate transport system permease small subunit
MKALTTCTRWMSYASAAALSVIVLATVADIGMAQFGSRPIIGVYELVGTALAFLVFLGIPETFRADENITVNVIDHLVPPRAVRLLQALGAVCSVLLLALMLWSMAAPAADAVKFNDVKPDSGIPVWVAWAAVLAGTAMALIACLVIGARWLRHESEGDGSARGKATP